jgi:RimJ/RimL family protein N-acetyltransferase
MPFFFPWTDGIGKPGFVDHFVEHHRAHRREWSPASWRLNLAVFLDGKPMGSQSVRADDFARSRVVDTGSWLGRRYQRQGYGTEMRGAVLGFAFEGLGAEAATSGYLEGNVASAKVSARYGYEPDGEGVVSPRGMPVREIKLRLERERWQPPFPVEIDGLEPCLPLFGL